MKLRYSWPQRTHNVVNQIGLCKDLKSSEGKDEKASWTPWSKELAKLLCIPDEEAEVYSHAEEFFQWIPFRQKHNNA